MTNVEEIFTEAYAQTEPNQTQQQPGRQQSLVNTVTINLQNGLSGDGSILYREIGSIESNVQELQGIEVRNGTFSDASVSDDILSISFPANVPNPQDPNRENILDGDISLFVNSVETKPDGLKIYYAGPGPVPSYISEFEVAEGILEQTSKEGAVLKLLVENKNK
ncbi:MAG: hypothetical protein L0H55_13015 [Candidatus Nitrosocosmicus sp.]|nr:hypothetical protein [Candidatus Nitrosocosmicus sp.]